jgi:hypothetical protein
MRMHEIAGVMLGSAAKFLIPGRGTRTAASKLYFNRLDVTNSLVVGEKRRIDFHRRFGFCQYSLHSYCSGNEQLRANPFFTW